MAGYLFGLDSEKSLTECIQSGRYSTRISTPHNGIWRIAQEGTFADYSSMKEGDNVYFFIERKIYGIGRLKNIGEDCKYLNFPAANQPTTPNRRELQNLFLTGNTPDSINQRFICLFEPFPMFFRNGIDMDDVLSSSPEKFKILRVFWKLSFIKFGDEENQAFRDILLRRNAQALIDRGQANRFLRHHRTFHQTILDKIDSNNYRLDVTPFLNTINSGTLIKHEMAIEASLIYQLSNGDNNSINVFGSWDYLSHQVVASPFKPVDYIDKMDVFGYAYILNEKPTIGKYLVVELKKGIVTEQDLLQLMKYVDWVKNEYSSGDYSIINAFLVGHDFEEACVNNLREIVQRNYVYGVRPSTTAVWRNVKLVKYRYIVDEERINYDIVADAN